MLSRHIWRRITCIDSPHAATSHLAADHLWGHRLLLSPLRCLSFLRSCASLARLVVAPPLFTPLHPLPAPPPLTAPSPLVLQLSRLLSGWLMRCLSSRRCVPCHSASASHRTIASRSSALVHQLTEEKLLETTFFFCIQLLRTPGQRLKKRYHFWGGKGMFLCFYVIWRQQQEGNWRELPPTRHPSFFLNHQDSDGCQCGEGERQKLFGPPPSNFHNARHFHRILFAVKAIPSTRSIIS